MVFGLRDPQGSNPLGAEACWVIGVAGERKLRRWSRTVHRLLQEIIDKIDAAKRHTDAIIAYFEQRGDRKTAGILEGISYNLSEAQENLRNSKETIEDVLSYYL